MIRLLASIALLVCLISSAQVPITPFSNRRSQSMSYVYHGSVSATDNVYSLVGVNNSSLFGTAVCTPSGYAFYAAYDSLRVGQSLNGTDFSICFWTKLGAADSNNYALSDDSDNSVGNMWVNLSVYVRLTYYYTTLATNTFSATGATLTSGQWAHVVITYTNSSKNCTVYLDGVSAGTSTFDNDVPHNGTWYIGCRESDGAFLNGWIDDFRLYNRVLTIQEIYYMYKKGKRR